MSKVVTRKRKDGLTVNVRILDSLEECKLSAGKGDAVKGEAKLVEFLTMYALQKDVFPEAFDDLVESETGAIPNEAKFERAYETVEVTNADGTTKNVKKYIDPHKTEGDYVTDFRKQTAQHGNTHIGLHADPTGELVKRWLQDVLNRKTYEMDLSAAGKERKVKIDEVFLKGARGGIIDKTGDDRQRWIDKWKANFDKLGVDCGDFETEDIQANVQVLAMALYKYTLAKSAQQFS